MPRRDGDGYAGAGMLIHDYTTRPTAGSGGCGTTCRLGIDSLPSLPTPPVFFNTTPIPRGVFLHPVATVEVVTQSQPSPMMMMQQQSYK